MWTKIVSKLPAVGTLLGSKWFIGIASSAVVGASVWLYLDGRHDGYKSGAADTAAAYSQQINDQVARALSDRDAEWNRETQEFYEDVKRIFESNVNTEALEASLRQELEAIQQQLREQENRLPQVDVGTCNLTDEFDRLFDESDSTGDRPTSTSSGSS